MDIFKFIEKSVNSGFKAYETKLKSKLSPIRNFPSTMKRKISGSVKKIIAFLFEKPTSLQEYIKVSKTYISKRFILKTTIILIIFVAVSVRVIVPFLQERFLGQTVVINTEEYHKSNGKTVVLNEQHEKLYVGNISNGKITGSGTLFDKKEIVYEGEFKDEKYCGDGKLYENKHLIYEGEFDNNQYNGLGKELYDNGNTKAQGTYINGELNGSGQKYFENGDIQYDGSFTFGEYNGDGILYSSNQRRMIYEGEFKRNEFDGQGKYYNEENGRLIYEGEFYQGEYNGEGILYNDIGQEIYKGNFFKGEIDFESFVDKDISVIREHFNEEEELIPLDNTFLTYYEDIKIMFEMSYATDENMPKVNKIIFLGNQKIFDVFRGISLDKMKEVKDHEVFTEYLFSVTETESHVLEKLNMDNSVDKLYCIKYILGNIYIRAYSEKEDGNIVYYEIGGI